MLFTLLLNLVVSAAGVLCYQIGRQWYDSNQIQFNTTDPVDITLAPQLDPFTVNQSFDIIDINDTGMRFQLARGTAAYTPQQWSESRRSSRVTDSTWSATPESVFDTIKTYMSPNNDKLWLLGGYKALAYAGVIKPYAALTPQTGLFDKTTVVTFIFASGKAKLQTVGFAEPNDPDVQAAEGAHIFGILGTVDPAQDYSYAGITGVLYGLRIVHSNAANKLPGSQPKPPGQQFYADKFISMIRANGDCVVIDLRNIGTYSLNTIAYNNAEFCAVGTNGKVKVQEGDGILR